MPDEVQPVEPEVPPWAETPWRAWMELSGDRPFTVSGFAAPMGGVMIQSRPGPLPWALLQDWCDRAGLDDADREFVLEVVRAVDRAFLAHWHKQQEQKSAANASRFGEPRGNSVAEKLARWDAMED